MNVNSLSPALLQNDVILAVTKEVSTFESYENYPWNRKQSKKSYKVETKGKMNGTEDKK